MSKGKFIVFEGLDGAGTTTQARLTRDWLTQQHIPAYLTQEPSEGPAGLLIRMALAGRLMAPEDGQPRKLDPRTLALFFATDRMDHLQSTIIPHLQAGAHVISDRYYLSSFVYQSLDAELDWVRMLNKHCLTPDVTLLLDVPVSVCKGRMEQAHRHLELYEDAPTLERVRGNYFRIADKLRSEGEIIHQLDGTASIAEVQQEVRAIIKLLLKHRYGD